MKNEEEQQKIRMNWCERHLCITNFSEVFFSDETTFNLDNPKGWLWLKMKTISFIQKIKVEK